MRPRGRRAVVVSCRRVASLQAALSVLLSVMLVPVASAATSREAGASATLSSRFEAEVRYQLGDGIVRSAQATQLTDDTAAFWFFAPETLEIIVKVLDGRAINGHHWVYFGALSDLLYTVHVRDTATGSELEYHSTAGVPTSLADTRAFADSASPRASWPAPEPVPGDASDLLVLAQPHLEEVDPSVGGTESLRHEHCVDGRAGGYPCRLVDLQALVPLTEMGSLPGDALSASDLWGWTDAETHRELALVGLSDGTAFVEVTDPGAPRYLGKLPANGPPSIWRDVKTYGNYALIVADGSPGHGLQVFDLRRLLGGTEPQTWDEDAVYSDFGLAHNLAVNEANGTAYATGSDTCDGGLHMISVRDPLRPSFAGCFDADGYTHDAQCVDYQGPDQSFSERHICFASNEDSLTIVDVTNPERPQQISRTDYLGRSYAHQAWLTEDQRYLLLDDEADERRFEHGTRTYVWDVSSLRSPRVIGTHTASTAAVDHNQYVSRGYVFQANYRAGLRILELDRVHEGQLREIGYFDVEPADDEPRLNGAWSTYPFFESGTVLVSDTGRGLFVLSPVLPGFAVPETPLDLTATSLGYEVELSWRSGSHHAASFRVYRQVGSAPEILLAALPHDQPRFIDREVFPGAEVTYRVVAVLGSRESQPAEAVVTSPALPESCTPSSEALCLGGGRFEVRVAWSLTSGERGIGRTVPLTSESGAFWFFDSDNVELVVKILDGRDVNDAFWVFLAGLSDVDYTVAIADLEGGRVRSYHNAAGDLASRADTLAFLPAP